MSLVLNLKMFMMIDEDDEQYDRMSDDASWHDKEAIPISPNDNEAIPTPIPMSHSEANTTISNDAEAIPAMDTGPDAVEPEIISSDEERDAEELSRLADMSDTQSSMRMGMEAMG